MKLTCLICAITILAIGVSQAHAITLTFDDVPDGAALLGYHQELGVDFMDGASFAVDHTASAWGPPHSGSNVLTRPNGSELWIGINRGWHHPPSADAFAAVVGAYFSTQPGAVIQMLGYNISAYDEPVASVTIGAPGDSWNNVYAQIASPVGIGFVRLVSVTPDGLKYFCADDMTVSFVPEPSSLSFLSLALTGLGIGAVRRRR